jgi:hypothetical protein
MSFGTRAATVDKPNLVPPSPYVVSASRNRVIEMYSNAKGRYRYVVVTRTDLLVLSTERAPYMDDAELIFAIYFDYTITHLLSAGLYHL